MKNNFSFNKGLKNLNKREKFLICNIRTSVDYPSTLEYKEVLLPTLRMSYIDYQKFLLCKRLPFLGPYSQY